MLDQNFQDILDKEAGIFRGASDSASQAVLDLIAEDKLRARDRKPPQQALEFASEQKEISICAASEYKFHHREWGQNVSDQDALMDVKTRLVNWLSIKDFMLKLLSTGKQFFLTDAHYPGMFGLWQGSIFDAKRSRYICSVQQPMMPEWGVLRVDEHEIAINWRYKGWRTVLLQMITENILTETEAHKAFGPAPVGPASPMYRKRLFDHRHGI